MFNAKALLFYCCRRLYYLHFALLLLIGEMFCFKIEYVCIFESSETLCHVRLIAMKFLLNERFDYVSSASLCLKVGMMSIVSVSPVCLLSEYSGSTALINLLAHYIISAALKNPPCD